MDKVFIVQEPTKRVNGSLVPVFDMTPAMVYGELVVLLPPGNVMLSTAPMVQELKHKLRDFDDGDYLIPAGDPAAMAAASMVAASMNRGRVNILKWDRETRQYVKMRIEL